MGIEISSLGEIIKEIEKAEASIDILTEAFSSFSCKQNYDEEDFLKTKAFDYEKHNKARTYLVMDDGEIVAYFSLAFKSIDLQPLSKNQKKKITAGESGDDTYSAYLIGHIAKKDGYDKKMGEFLLDSAIDLIFEAQKIVGGRLVYLDCKDQKKLIELYENYGFSYFNTSEKTGLLQYYKKL